MSGTVDIARGCTVLVVDDERTMRMSMKALLVGEGYTVRFARNGEEAVESVRASKPDLVMLDIMMPKRNGFSACGEIRRLYPLLPIIFLTAKEEEADQIRGFGLGADDYVSKSESDAKMLARIRRALERSAAYRVSCSEARTISLGRVVVDVDSLLVVCDGVETRLTKTEADILWLLDSDRGRLFRRGEIIESLRRNGFTGDENSLYTHVYNLKRKLGPAGDLVANERGVGYRLI